MPKEANDYEFIVVRKDENGEYWYWGAFENGWIAEEKALSIKGGMIYHNVRIQGKRKRGN